MLLDSVKLDTYVLLLSLQLFQVVFILDQLQIHPLVFVLLLFGQRSLQGLEERMVCGVVLL